MFLNNKKDKRGTDKMLSMYWFAIILLVSVGIFAMVYIFYSAPYEVREIETKILSQKIVDCFSRQGRINPGVMSKNQFNPGFNLLEECSLTFEVEDEYDWKEEEQFFVEVEFYEVSDLNNPLGVLSEGNLNWKTNCFIKNKKEEDYERFVKCNEERIYAIGDGHEQYLIKVLVGVAKIEKNARQ